MTRKLNSLCRLGVVSAAFGAALSANALVAFGGAGNDSAHAITFDAAGNCYVAGQFYSGAGTGNDIAVAKYDPAGAYLGAYVYPGVMAGGNDGAVDVKVNAAGDIFVTGFVSTPASGFDMVTLWLNPGGALMAVDQYNGPGNGDDIPMQLIFDPAGNVYVTGRSLGAGTNMDIATIKYNPALARLWLNRWNGAGGVDEPSRMLFNGGNLYICGHTFSPAGNFDGVLIRLGAGAGVFLNRQVITGPAGNDDNAADLAINGAGNVYLASTVNAAGVGDQITVTEYTPNIAALVAGPFNFNRFGARSDIATRIAVLPGGNVVVGGSSQGGAPVANYDYVLLQVAGGLGGLAAAPRYYVGPVPGADDVLTDMAVDPATGNVFATGISPSVAGGKDYLTLGIGMPGIWPRRFGGAGAGADIAAALAISPVSGGPCVTGTSFDPFGAGSGDDWGTTQYSPAGATLW